jgi:hypothetical protein
MEKFMKVFMMVVCLLFLVGTANASVHMMEALVIYNKIEYPEFHLDMRGGTDGHSGAYVTIMAGVTDYYEMSKINIKAEHTASDFEISLVEDHPECVGAADYPFGPTEQYFWVSLQPLNWMKGEWKITLTYKDSTDVKQTEIRFVNVSNFYYPPVPTGLQIAEELGKTWLIWNRIADPSAYPNTHRYQPVIKHYTSSPHCVDEFHRIIPDSGLEYRLWKGNRIAVAIPSNWQHGDLIKIENRIYGPGGFGRACKYIILP